MLKRFSYSALGLGLLAAMTACSSNEEMPDVKPGQEVAVTLTAQLPEGIETRAFSDGSTATSLSYAVYDAEATTLTPLITSEDEVTFTNKKATVTLQLVTGKSYDIIFWADKGAQSAYTFNAATQTVTVDYTNASASDEGRDAFYAHVDAFKVDGTQPETVKLYRPFAQINVGTNDKTQAQTAGLNVMAAKASMTVDGVYKTLNLKYGAVSDQVTEAVTFSEAVFPTGEEFKKTGYEYVEMNYVLVAEDAATVNATVSISDGSKVINTLNIPNVPVQRNYRTNIYGSLLTTQNLFNLEIVPDYDGADLEVPVVSTTAEFLKALTEGGNLKLESDLTSFSSHIIDVKNETTIDLNGKTLSTPSNSTGDMGLAANGTSALLTFNGKGTVTAGVNVIPVSSCNGGKVVINDGTYVGSNSLSQDGVEGPAECLYITGDGTIEINGGYFKTKVASVPFRLNL